MLNPDVDFDSMIEQANAAVTTLTPEEVAVERKLAGTILVDIRDVRELERDGRIPGSKHVPRGMLEFWIHPQSPYFKEYFSAAEQVILYCNKGWRSALAARALHDLGMEVAHMSGGFGAWQDQGLETEPYERSR